MISFASSFLLFFVFFVLFLFVAFCLFGVQLLSFAHTHTHTRTRTHLLLQCCNVALQKVTLAVVFGLDVLLNRRSLVLRL